ncbi:hypothetical protein [Nesterenkonia rhizosphaerae]
MGEYTVSAVQMDHGWEADLSAIGITLTAPTLPQLRQQIIDVIAESFDEAPEAVELTLQARTQPRDIESQQEPAATNAKTPRKRGRRRKAREKRRKFDPEDLKLAALPQGEERQDPMRWYMWLRTNFLAFALIGLMVAGLLAAVLDY